MLCLHCGRLSVPDTRWGGSDTAEFFAWGLLPVAAWFYCYWRHLGRGKACPHCGSQELMRETRAARQWRGEAPHLGHEGTASLASPAHRLMELRRRPRNRLSAGALAALLGCGTACAGALGFFGSIGTGRMLAYGQLASLAGLGCFALGCLVQGSGGTSLARCRAWDEHGRRLRIEAI